MKKLKYIILLTIVLFFLARCDYKIPAFAGSYCYSENYRIIEFTDVVIEKIQEFKTQNPQYEAFRDGIYKMDEYENYTNLPNDTTLYIFDGDTAYGVTSRRTTYTDVRTDSSIWYFCYFYFSDINATIRCVINLRGSNFPTIIRLTHLTYTSDFYDGKTINKRGEISRKENQMIKEKFETEILDKLGEWKRY